MAWYSTLVDDWETIDYFLLFQEIRESPKKLQNSITDLWFVGSLPWSASKYARSSKKEVDESKRLWKIIPRRYCKIRRTVAQWKIVGEATNWLTTWTIYAISGRVMVRYTKLPTIVRYKVRSIRGKPSEEECLALTSIGVSKVLFLVSLARSRILSPVKIRAASTSDFSFLVLLWLVLWSCHLVFNCGLLGNPGVQVLSEIHG